MILSSSGNIPQARLFKSNLGTFFAAAMGRKLRLKSKLNLLNANFVYILHKYDINPKFNIDKVRGLVHSKARPLCQHQDGRR
jgi:hypothetical protein